MVNRYRPWSDHGGSPVLELVGEEGMTPPNAPEIYPDYNTLVVLAADYAAIAAELAAAHIQCGHNQLTINALGERCSALEAALIEIRDKGLHHVQSWHVEKAASALETKANVRGDEIKHTPADGAANPVIDSQANRAGVAK